MIEWHGGSPAWGILIWALSTFTLVAVVVMLQIGAPVRAVLSRFPLGQAFITCPACVGFWMGVLVSLLGLSPSRATGLETGTLIRLALDGLASSSMSLLVYLVIVRLAGAQVQIAPQPQVGHAPADTPTAPASADPLASGVPASPSSGGGASAGTPPAG